MEYSGTGGTIAVSRNQAINNYKVATITYLLWLMNNVASKTHLEKSDLVIILLLLHNTEIIKLYDCNI